MQLRKASTTQYHTKQEMVYHTLRDAILHGALSPGQRLVIDEIAQALQISHIPVREAIQILQSEGLVETIPHTGVRVTSISRNSIIEAFTLIEGLELVATRTAAMLLDPGHTATLAALLAEMDATLQTHDYQHWGDLNTAFHHTIAAITGMPLLLEMTDRALRQWDRVRQHFFSQVLAYRAEQAQSEHRAILQAMQENDVERLDQLVKQHNRDALAAYLECMA
jgi:DNA-binding GntR family transcriptional regulator